ncbi:hypothetical protein C8A05DRAFT_39706, partial [Staphylotrichum tortipilum]
MPSFFDKYKPRHRRRPTSSPSSPPPPSTPTTRDPSPNILSPTPSNPSQPFSSSPSTPATLSPSSTLDLPSDKTSHTHLTLPLRTPSSASSTPRSLFPTPSTPSSP